MEEILKNKLKEKMMELRDLISKDKVSDNHKNFVMGELSMLIELLEDKKEE